MNFSLALALSDDVAATTEFELVLKIADPDELDSIKDTVERALKRKPESAILKAMKNSVDKAFRRDFRVTRNGINLSRKTRHRFRKRANHSRT